jgi:hypothetical protein
MYAHQIGTRLREHILRDHRSGRPVDPRRLQALIADLCGAEEQELMAPLRHLVLSSTFATAAGMDPPLTDGRHLHILSSELIEVFAPTLCTRMQPVLQGLMGMAATATFMQGSAIQPECVKDPAASVLPTGSVASPAVRVVGKAPTNAVLAFLSGVLLMTLGGVVLLVWQQERTLAPTAPDTSSFAPAGAPGMSSDPADSRAMPGQSELRSASSGEFSPVLVTDRALRSIQDLYALLSAKDFEKSSLLYGGGAADQFSPVFFSQFKRVTVQKLSVTSKAGSFLNLEGEVTFVWPDGSIQSETRSFSVDTSSEPPLITASEFGRVITPRR